MKPFHPKECKLEYHPDDTPEYYLPENIEERIIREIQSEVETKKDRDTLDFIRAHEDSQRKVAYGKMKKEAQTEYIDDLSETFRRKYGEWVHVLNPLYIKFYEAVQNSKLYD